eukprot:CAMPEP_0172568972 /NCGR_PEP_ID=MMETSP1067-20121228/121712_1 /TAXON_ID=265564 ORGANISM="Thalassiosira punctigera, Strain Tpunct2005C2" /NCGR_SAMPLE_ID=MMETSP1067 /ASSEMBLY_ACC=CAM_ASM_000444 /LENGTH=70 /DNA_ID=CAMNT_0013360703 /DNA_START=246 /DNA_END=458 /DNA_ORIENTATION=-
MVTLEDEGEMGPLQHVVFGDANVWVVKVTGKAAQRFTRKMKENLMGMNADQEDSWVRQLGKLAKVTNRMG